MSNTPQGAESPLANVERRLCVRRAIPSLAYVDLGENNGGIILNIGEGGLAVTSVAPLFADTFSRMRFQLPGSSDWLEASGEITRISESKKEAGLQFVGLSEDARKQIKVWVSSAETPGQWRQETVNVSLGKEQPAGLPSARAVKGATADRRSDQEEGLVSSPVRREEPSPTGSLAEAPNLLPDPNRRVHVRKAVPSLAYVNFGENNGGIILNIGEGGLAVTSVAPLFTDDLSRMRFQLPGSSDWLEASGEITRISESKKEAGLQFVGLSEDTRKQIQDWISSIASSAELQQDGMGGREQAWRRLEMPVLGIPQSTPSSLANPDRVRRKYAQISVPNPPSALVNTKPWAAAPASTVMGWKLSKTAGYQPGVEVGYRSKRILSRRASWTSVAVAVFLGAFLAGWFTSRPGRIFAPPGPTRAESETTEVAGSPGANFVAGPPGPSTPNAFSQVDQPQAVASSTARDFAGRTARGARSTAGSNGLAPASSGAKSSLTQVVHSPGPVKENAPPPEPASIATQTQEATPANPNVSTPEGIRTAGQDSPPPLKPAENPEVPKASVSVNFGLYPSIRVPPGLKSQKPQQGASLQIGQLLSRVDPVYPEDAKAQRIEGAVKLHAIIGPDGTIASIESRGGPALLIPAATDAVRQWRYTPSSVGSQPVEAEEDITITFRISK